jgi:Ca2+-binding RTX toxin-like protein
LIGGLGNDTLDGGTGADIMSGGQDSDVYLVDEVGDVVNENVGEGVDTIQSSVSYALGANLENLTLTGSANINGTGNEVDNTLIGNSGSNTLIGAAGNDVLESMGGNDTLIGGIGNDTYVIDAASNVILENAAEGIDTVQSSVSYTLGTNLENLTLSGSDVLSGTGNSLDNVINGNYGDNTLIGGAGNDTLDGSYGNDSMIGGVGNDIYFVDSTADVVTENTGEGTDTVQSAVTYTLSANTENLVLLETGGAINGTGNSLVNILSGNSANNILSGGTGADTLIGGLGNDTFVVDNAGDLIVEYSSEGVDVVQSSVTYTLAANVENLTLTGTTAVNGIGNELDNTFTGNSAANTLVGGGGNDTFVIGSTDTVVENAGEGIDTVQASFSYTLTANVEKLTLTGTTAINATGNSIDNTLTGNSAVNVLTGLAGNDLLDGKAGADTLIGGVGDDIYVVDNIGDVVTESAGEGADTVQSSIAYTLGTNLENLTLTGTTAINGTGNASNNVMVGNSAINTLTGAVGDDVIDGGAGADKLIGGTGNDTYYIDNTGDVVTENASEGVDLVNSAITYTLGANVENLTLTGTAAINGMGNTVANIINGNTGANILDGGVGADTLIGGTGNDTYVIDDAGDVVVETSTLVTEIDLVQSAISYTLGANLEKLTLTGTASNNGVGNSLNNTLTGNAGNNVLDGGLGNDTLVGGSGDDTYVVDSASDVVTEAASAGTDVIQSSVTYTLSTNVENLTLTGTAAINGTGNTLNNILIGNSASNTLSGGTGIDTLIGGNGDDIYVVDVAGDVVTENANEGVDRIQSAATYTLGANVENLTLTGSSAINGIGNELDNVLVGNSGANTLTGGAGNDVLDGGAGVDRLIGGSGDDTYVLSVATDVVVENAAEGTDTVQSVVTYTLGADVENLTLTGTAAINGTGNSGANVFTGNSANNTLTGAAGSDTYVFGRDGAADKIIDSDSTAGNTDVLLFLNGVATDQLWFRHVGNNLEVSIIGTSDTETISNWYSGSANHIEQFKTSDGKVLLDTQVDNLVSAMAAFSPPSAGQTTLPQNYQDSLNAVIAANWH